MFRRKNKTPSLSFLEKAYVELVEKYTSIFITQKTPQKAAHAKSEGTFLTGISCSLFLVHKKCFAIRFENNMKNKDFHDVFHLLVKEFGDPKLVAAFRGYVWKREGYVVTFGNIPLNYDNEVPMICVEQTLGIFANSTPYQTYQEMNHAILSPLKSWGIIEHEDDCCPISYVGKEGYRAYFEMDNLSIFITFNKGNLGVYMIPVTRLENGFTRIEHTATRYTKDIRGVGTAEIASHLESILEESKEIHGLTRAES